MTGIDKQRVGLALEELANREEQERLWLSDGSSGEVSSFTEAICGLYDDSGLSRALDSGELSDELSKRFCELSRRIDRMPQDISPQEQIDHPAMKEISIIAREILAMWTDAA